MFIRQPLRRITMILAAGTVPALLALSLHNQPAAKASVVPEDQTAIQTARLLDSIAQERFASARMVVFGVSRIATVATTKMHDNSMAAESPAEQKILDQVNSAQRDYVVSFLHCAAVPEGKSPPRLLPLPGKRVDYTLPAPAVSVTGQISVNAPAVPGMIPAPGQPYLTPLVIHQLPSPMTRTAQLIAPGMPLPSRFVTRSSLPPGLSPLQRGLLYQAQKAMPSLQQGHEFLKTTEGWTLLLSPISASKDSCLTCHVGAKRGDTLGVMAYAVSHGNPDTQKEALNIKPVAMP